VELIKKDALFEFAISFENFTEEEYGLLLTTLELEPDLGHKIGMGKPLGLGSCVIEVTEIKEFTKDRYLSMDQKGAKVYKDGELQNRKKEIKGWWGRKIPQDLRCILALNNGFAEIRYPVKANNEFSIYKKLHPPCREFSDDEKKGSNIVYSAKQGGSKKPDKPESKRTGIMAEAFKKAKKSKKK
jgi:hypothetical protein